MIAAIHRGLTEIGNWSLDKSGRCRGWLRPQGHYWLRIYSENDSSDPAGPLVPCERNDLMVIRSSNRPDADSEPSPPKDAGPLLLRVLFRVDNDLPIARVVRWTFASKSQEDYATYRVVLRVLPHRRSQWSLLFSVIGVMFMSACFDTLYAHFTGREDFTSLAYDLGWAFTLSSVFLVIGFFLLKLVEKLYIHGE